MRLFQTIERWIKRALFYLEGAGGKLLNAKEHAVAVQRSERDGFEDEEIETTGKKFCVCQGQLSSFFEEASYAALS
jgi:hypothetical protein